MRACLPLHRQLLSFAALALVLVCTPACRNEIAADLQIDNQSFVPKRCRSGQLNGFAGVDLLGGGRTLRIVQTPTTEPQVILLGGAQVIDFGLCGSMVLQRQSSMINEVFNVMGSARLKCSAAGHSVEGTVNFKNCH